MVVRKISESRLKPEHIDVWFVDVKRLLPTGRQADILSPLENEQASRFRLDRDRKRFINRHVVLRELLARYTGRDVRNVEIRYGAYGKPCLLDQATDSAIQFSLAHSAGVAVVAIGLRNPIGVDIEKMKMLPEMEGIVAQHFTTRERRLFNAYSGCQRVEMFYRFWVRKEAVLKASGEGLMRPALEIDVSRRTGVSKQAVVGGTRSAEPPSRSPSGGSRSGDLGAGISSDRFHCWTLQDVDFLAGFAAAVAVIGPNRGLRCFHFPT